MDLEQLPLIGGSVLAAPIRVDQQLFRLHLSLAQGAAEGLQHRRRLHRGTKRLVDDALAAQMNPHCQLIPAGCCADVGDFTVRIAVRRLRGEVPVDHIVSQSSSAGGFAAEPEGPAGFGPHATTLHQRSNAMATDRSAHCTQFLMDPQRTVEATVLVEHRLDFSYGHYVLSLPLSRRCLLPVPPGIEVTAVNVQLPSQPGRRVARDHYLSGETSRRQLLFCKVACT